MRKCLREEEKILCLLAEEKEKYVKATFYLKKKKYQTSGYLFLETGVENITKKHLYSDY